MVHLLIFSLYILVIYIVYMFIGRKNNVRVEVMFKTLNVQKTVQTESYTATDLLSKS